MKHSFIKFNVDDIDNLVKTGMSTIIVELDHNSRVVREVGIAKHDKVVHRFPGDGPYGRYGLFDNAQIEVTESNDSVSEKEFNKLYYGN